MVDPIGRIKIKVFEGTGPPIAENTVGAEQHDFYLDTNSHNAYAHDSTGWSAAFGGTKWTVDPLGSAFSVPPPEAREGDIMYNPAERLLYELVSTP